MSGADSDPRPRGRRRISIGLKVGLGVSLVVIVASVLLFFELSARERAHLVDAKQMAGTTVVELFASSLAAPMDFEDEEAVRAEIDLIAERPGVVWVGVRDPTGRVVAEKGPPSERGAGAGDRIGGARMELSRPVVGRGQKGLGTATVVFSLAAENARFAASREEILRLCVMLALGTASLLVLAAHLQIVRPLVRLADAARDLERGRGGVRVDIDRGDEVGQLAAAFNAMSGAVVDRERELAEARDELREVLDGMDQAIVVFGVDGRLVGVRSAAAESILGAGAVEGALVSSLLYPGSEPWEAERRAFDEWRDLAFASEDQWVLVAELAPREVVLDGPAGRRTIELEFQPLFAGDRIDRIMLLAIDATERRGLLRDKQQREIELASLRRVLASGAVFARFLESSRARVDRCRELATSEESGAALVEIFQHVHTLRGEAASFDLVELERIARDAEGALTDLRRGRDEPAHRAALAEAIDAAGAALAAAERRFVELSPTGEDVLHRVTVDRRDLAQLGRAAAGATGEIAEVARRLTARPLGELCATLPERASAWGTALGKRVRVEVAARQEPVPERLAAVLPGILAHLVRNAVAHGIEVPAQRVQAGKPEVGLVRIVCEATPLGPRVVVEDDGAGLGDAEPGSRTSYDRIFDPGFSTGGDAEGLSGHGMGLSAAKREAERAAYDVRVAESDGPGARFEIVPVGTPTELEGVA